jgi:hypothetical protein
VAFHYIVDRCLTEIEFFCNECGRNTPGNSLYQLNPLDFVGLKPILQRSHLVYQITYVDDEAYRRRILTQLNRGEGRHSLSRAIFYGRRGEVRQRYREGQEEQLSALGLVVNVLVLWNTYYMNTALNHLRIQGTPVKAEDIARLSPLAYSHINMLGRYHFNLPLELLDGGMRLLRDLNDSKKTWAETLCV